MKNPLVVALALVAGLTGGAISKDLKRLNPFPVMKPAAAKQTFGAIKATEVQIVDDLGRIVAILGADSEGGVLVLKSPQSDFDVVEVILAVSDKRGVMGLSNGENARLISSIDSAGDSFILGSRSDGSDAFGLGVDVEGEGFVKTWKKTGSTDFDSRNSGSTTTSGLLGDLDNDGDVDFADFFGVCPELWSVLNQGVV